MFVCLYSPVSSDTCKYWVIPILWCIWSEVGQQECEGWGGRWPWSAFMWRDHICVPLWTLGVPLWFRLSTTTSGWTAMKCSTYIQSPKDFSDPICDFSCSTTSRRKMYQPLLDESPFRFDIPLWWCPNMQLPLAPLFSQFSLCMKLFVFLHSDHKSRTEQVILPQQKPHI